LIGRVLIIAGSDSGGGAGIQADIKTVTALGGYAATAITAVTVQNTLGVTGVHPVPLDVIEAQARAVLEDIGADVVKTGMLGTAEVVALVARLLEAAGLPAVVDPVMVAKGGPQPAGAGGGGRGAHADGAARSAPDPQRARGGGADRSAVVDMDGQRRAGEALLRLGARAVLMKGRARAGRDRDDLLVTPEGDPPSRARGSRRATRTAPAARLASACAAGLAQGLPLTEAVARAWAYTAEAVRRAPGFGAARARLITAGRCGRRGERLGLAAGLKVAAPAPALGVLDRHAAVDRDGDAVQVAGRRQADAQRHVRDSPGWP
jgi:hydroxymethylpyrimidine/phosphomethylpyrimidine kinase